MKKSTPFIFLVLLSLLAGCSSVAVKTDYDREVNFSRFQTFKWMPYPKGKRKRDMVAKNSALDKHIRKDVERELKAKGFEVKRKGRTDALLAYHVGLQERIDVSRVGYGYRWYRGGRVHRHRYREGTLIIDVVDPQSKQLIWRGSASSAIGSLDESEKKINEAIAKLFEQYPPES